MLKSSIYLQSILHKFASISQRCRLSWRTSKFRVSRQRKGRFGLLPPATRA